MSLPKHLSYSNVKPVGVPSKVKIAKFIPQSAYGNISATDTIRFQINSPGFWDPYSAYFNIEVEITDNTDPGFMQIDHSAHSLISELIIYSKGAEIERIQEYDSLAAVLGDIHLSPEQRSSRSHEGYGYRVKDKPAWEERSETYTPYFSGGTLTGVVHGNAGPNPLNKKFYTNDGGEVAWLVESGGATLNEVTTWTNTGTLPKIGAAKSYYTTGWDTSKRNMFGLTRADENMLEYEDKCLYSANDDSLNRGFVRINDISLGGGCNEQRFYTSARDSTISGGRLQVARAVTKCQFSIPIISGLLGVLMPRDSYKYIPMAALEDLIIELRLSKHALFSSGFKEDVWSTVDTTNFNNDNPFMKTGTTQIGKGYKISKFELMADIIMFDRAIEDAVLNQLNTDDGIVLHSTSWYLGPQFLIANTQSVTGTWQINLGFESLKNVIFFFLSEDYKTKNFCRKQYRLSKNLTWMQLKIGIDYFPSLPIEGNAGCIANTEGNGDNSEFLINLYKTFNKLHDVLSDNFINQVNFAVNERPYDVTKTGPFYKTSDNSLDNIHTACGLPGFFENQCVGKAVYGLNLEGLREDASLMSGINTIQNKPFEITLRSDPSTVTTVLDRPATMYVMCYYDFLIQLKSSGIRVLGRG